MTPSTETPDPSSTAEQAEIRHALDELLLLKERMTQRESQLAELIGTIPEECQESAVNLIHYLAVRSHDLHGLQEVLSRFGLSSLGRMESHVTANVDTVISVLKRLAGAVLDVPLSGSDGLTAVEARTILRRRAELLFDKADPNRTVRIMVTLPTEAATDPALVRDLLASGANSVRINCAHDDATIWRGMIDNVRKAEAEVGTTCRIMMDLAGPRVRGGELEPGPEVLKVQPQRNEWGQVVRPASVWLTPVEQPEQTPPEADASLHLPADFISRLSEGDILLVEDTRGAHRTLLVTGGTGSSRLARLEKTAYFTTGTNVSLLDSGSPYDGDLIATAAVGPIPATEQILLLREGDHLLLTRSQEPGRPATRDEAGAEISPAVIPLTPPEAMEWLVPDQRIWFDEGRIGGLITAVDGEGAHVTVTMARSDGDRLRGGKGINLPDTTLRFPSLTEADLENLPFIAAHADIVGYSFVRSAADVTELQRVLAGLGEKQPGVVLKIEARSAYERLPEILLAALRHDAVGVMIARGDLAVECGFARLAEVQEEILWLCEAAHVPVVWATQVLEQLAKQGRPTRSEVTDAAMADRAECVMLNKGRYITGAVRALDSILRRMQLHQEKKFPILRPLHAAVAFFPESADEPADARP